MNKRFTSLEKSLQDSLRTAKIQVFGSVEQRAKLEISRREQCSRRGYHRIEELSKKDPQICYDCELWFGKDQGTKYRIEPL